jgi:pimeloyl-ACP methyl ester carboxylesterase
MYRIESFLSARLFVAPKMARDRLFFISNLSGQMSLYAMDYGGSVPEPLLPPHIALQNPHLIGGQPYYLFPKLNQILVMIDRDGDENYQPMLIPMSGGFPEPSFNNHFAEYRVHLGKCDAERNLVYLYAESRQEAMNELYQGNLESGELILIEASRWGASETAVSKDHQKIVLGEGYSMGDQVLYLWDQSEPGKKMLYGTPMDQRVEGQEITLPGFQAIEYTPSEKQLLIATALLGDTYGIGIMNIQNPSEIIPVEISGLRHTGEGELSGFVHLHDNLYLVTYNIDGCSWAYEAELDEEAKRLHYRAVVCGEGVLSSGVLESIEYDKLSDAYVLSFSTATSPTQIYTVSGADRSKITLHTRERIFGLEEDLLSPGEDASFISFDGQRTSARLYLPSEKLGFKGPRPLVYYIHGGPQSQERPDFAWFSMPLIQFLTLNGFTVFVPNVRGSTGYGLNYTKQVDRDWGGKDRLDHVHAMTEVLPKDERLDVKRAGVVGRSYGGYMTLTQAARHPQLWSAAVDMFGPYDLITFGERIPPTWKPYFAIALGDPEKDRDFLIERSPRTYIDQISCPLLVIQGKNDPRVVEQESRDVVERLQQQGKDVEYLMFENEGHDVLKYDNRVTCYNAITEYFKKHLRP